jgi:hypothetical protein
LPHLNLLLHVVLRQHQRYWPHPQQQVAKMVQLLCPPPPVTAALVMWLLLHQGQAYLMELGLQDFEPGQTQLPEAAPPPH